jgi:acid phosphatase (class A)
MRILVVAALLAGSASAEQASVPGAAMSAAMRPPTSGAAPRKVPPGYLAGKSPVDVIKLLPPPPKPGSAQDIADRTIYATSAQGIDGPAWNAAKQQLNPADAEFMGQLSCAVGRKISREATPATMAVLARAGVDFVVPMDTAKRYHKRLRPFTTDKGRACDPISDDGVGENLGYAYPSGHSGIGWLWALILSDAAPANASAIREFGVATGDLRVACRVHWLSDVAYGRVLANAIYQRIAAEPEYQADLKLASAELAAAPAAVCN